MYSFFFGSSNRKLYGSLEAGTGQVGALICGGWGPEAQASHRFLGVLSKRLAGMGLSTMRFDYYGSGDSYGAQRELTLESMTADTLSAIEELRDVEDLRSLRLIGYRLGAVPAISAARQIESPIVLVDPIMDGSSWLRMLEANPLAGELSDGALESGGFTMGKAMRESLSEVGPLIESFDGPEVAGVILSQPWSGKGIPSEKVEVCASDPTWRLDEGVGSATIPQRLVDTIVERICDLGNARL